jgi:hypothetical protein
MKTLVLSVVALTVLAHCYPSTAEGDRCNPALSHDECENAPTVQCVTPANCAESYCCGPSSTSANCQACPPPDAGE